MGDIGVSFLSSAIYDVLKFIFCKSIDEAQLYKIDKTIKAEIYKKYYDKIDSNMLNQLLSATSQKDLIKECILYNITDDIYSGHNSSHKNYDEMTINNLYLQVKKEYKKTLKKDDFTKFFQDYFELANQLLYDELDNSEKIQVTLFNKSIRQSESNILFFIKELQTKIEKLTKENPVCHVEKYREIVSEYHKMLKSRKSKERIYLLDKFEFSRFYVPPLLKQRINFNYNDVDYCPQYNVRSAINAMPFHFYDGWKHIFDCNNFVYIIGGPGYRKSLFLTKLINDYEQLNFLSDEEHLVIYGDLKAYKLDDDYSMSMVEYLQNCIVRESLIDRKYISKEMIEYFIDSGRCLLLFDALDEVEKNKRADLHERIVTYFENKNPNNKICITSRSRGFIPENDHIVYEILPLDQDQVETYIDNLIKLDKFDENDKKLFFEKAYILMDRNFLNSFLILSLLLHIFKSERNLPDTKLDLYKKCFEYIAFSREKEKNQKYNWNDLTGLMKNTTFSTLASMGLPNNNDIDRQDIIEMICENYRKQYGTMQATEIAAEQFLNYCSERTELFVLSSEENKFHFFHRSFFEYFYANYLFYHLEKVECIYEGLKQFDVDSEIFELTFALVKQNNEMKYQKLIEYVFEKCNQEIVKKDKTRISAFNILTLGMQVIDDIEYRDRYINFIIKNKKYIIEYQGEILDDKINEIIDTNKEYINTIVDEYCNEAKIQIIDVILSSIKKTLNNKKLEDDYDAELEQLTSSIEKNLIYMSESSFYLKSYIIKKNNKDFCKNIMKNEHFMSLLEKSYVVNNQDEIYLSHYNNLYASLDEKIKKEIDNILSNGVKMLKEFYEKRTIKLK